jgi:hypothetical protein
LHLGRGWGWGDRDKGDKGDEEVKINLDTSSSMPHALCPMLIHMTIDSIVLLFEAGSIIHLF